MCSWAGANEIVVLPGVDGGATNGTFITLPYRVTVDLATNRSASSIGTYGRLDSTAVCVKVSRVAFIAAATHCNHHNTSTTTTSTTVTTTFTPIATPQSFLPLTHFHYINFHTFHHKTCLQCATPTAPSPQLSLSSSPYHFSLISTTTVGTHTTSRRTLSQNGPSLLSRACAGPQRSSTPAPWCVHTIEMSFCYMLILSWIERRLS